jgi:hypothetical protein
LLWAGGLACVAPPFKAVSLAMAKKNQDAGLKPGATQPLPWAEGFTCVASPLGCWFPLPPTLVAFETTENIWTPL